MICPLLLNSSGDAKSILRCRVAFPHVPNNFSNGSDCGSFASDPLVRLVASQSDHPSLVGHVFFFPMSSRVSSDDVSAAVRFHQECGKQEIENPRASRTLDGLAPSNQGVTKNLNSGRPAAAAKKTYFAVSSHLARGFSGSRKNLKKSQKVLKNLRKSQMGQRTKSVVGDFGLSRNLNHL